MAKAPKFYCKKYCGDPDFCIHEWNKALAMCDELGIVGEEQNRILHPELFPCENQCDDCINTVLETKAKYAHL